MVVLLILYKCLKEELPVYIHQAKDLIPDSVKLVPMLKLVLPDIMDCWTCS